jgi:hypothetical protein
MAFNFNTMAKTLESILKDDERLAGFTVQRSEPPNETADRTPWIGIYKASESYEPHTIAAGQMPWKVMPGLILVLQCASLKSGSDADERLENAKRLLFEVLEDNLTIGGTVHMVNGWDVEYEYGGGVGGYFVSATINLQGEIRA